MDGLQRWWKRWKRKLGWADSPRLENFHCGNCGEALTSRDFCRSCGASEDSGWSRSYVGEEAEDDFDYHEYIEREFGQTAETRSSPRKRPLASTTWGIVILILLIVGMLLLQFGIH